MKNTTGKTESTTRHILQSVTTIASSNQKSENSDRNNQSAKPTHHAGKGPKFEMTIEKDSRIANLNKELEAVETEAREIMKHFERSVF